MLCSMFCNCYDADSELFCSVYERMWHNALLRLRDQLLIEDPTAGAIVPPHEDVPEVCMFSIV